MSTQLAPPIYSPVPNGLKASYSTDFSVDTIYNLYLLSTYQGDAVTPVSLYIDNLNSDQDITVTMGGMAQKVPAYSSASLQINGASSVQFQCNSSSTAQAAIDVLNYTISYGTSSPGRGISPSLNNYPVNAPSYSVLNSSKGAGYIGEQRTETGSVLRTSQDKLNETISFEDFGAKGDGVNNDTDAIANALNTGKNIVGPSGATYKTTSTITVSRNYQSINLNGSTIKPSGVFNALTIAANNGIFKNINIDLTNLTGWGISVPSAQQRFIFEDVNILNGVNGAQIIDAYTYWLNRVNFNGQSGTALDIHSSILNTGVNSAYLDKCSFGNNTYAGPVVSLKGCLGVFFNGCNWQSNSGVGSSGLRIQADNNNGNNHIEIAKCYFENHYAQTGNEIYIGDNVTGTNISDNVIIHGNYFLTTYQAVKIGGNVTHGPIITKNTFVNNAGAPAYAVSAPAGYVPDCHDNTGPWSDINMAFTPALQFGGANIGLTYTSNGQQGHIRRIGNRVYGEIYIALTTVGTSAGVTTITGLPIVSNSDTYTGRFSANLVANMSGLNGGIGGRINNGGNTVTLNTFNANGQSDLNNTNFTNTTSFFMTFDYDV